MRRIAVMAALSLMVLIGVGLGALYWAWLDMQTALDRKIFLHEHSELFDIERGESLASIARRMHKLGWIENDLYLRLEARRLDIATNLKAGLYEIIDRRTPRQLLRQFVDGEVKVFQLTFIEGSTFKEMREQLAKHRRLRATIGEMDDRWVATQLSSSIDSLEGQLFPSTYYFSNGHSDIDIIRRAYFRMTELLAFYWQSRAPDLPYASPEEALIMASIIEKETARADERAQIAGVFVRRLQRAMKLQTDPTVIYGMGDDFDGNLRRVDLQTDTPYNTYTRHGLPPTPIAMPGEASIKAALHPADGTFLYFVGKGDGSHQFSTSLREHNAAVRRYQLTSKRERP